MIEDAIQDNIALTIVQPVEPLEPDEMELMYGEIVSTMAKLNRQCNVMLNRPGGLSIHALQCLHHIKADISWLKWHVETQRLPDAKTA